MSLSLSQENKNSLTLSNESKEHGETWDSANYTWDEAQGTWDVPGLILSNESKNNLTITNESKN